MGLKVGDVKIGDLVMLKEEMMLVSPRGPVIVLKTDLSGVQGLCEVMYLSNNYVIPADTEMDIDRIINDEAISSPISCQRIEDEIIELLKQRQ